MYPHSGEVRIGNLVMCDKNRAKIRDDMTVCSQESLLFARTIRENVWYGNVEPPDDTMIADALDRVGLSQWAFHEQENGLDTMLARGEGQMSGGQAQRLKIARLLCKDKQYILLDEPCSALDSKNRNKVVAQLRKYLKQKTAIWITHHDSILNTMDNVVDMARLSES